MTPPPSDSRAPHPHLSTGADDPRDLGGSADPLFEALERVRLAEEAFARRVLGGLKGDARAEAQDRHRAIRGHLRALYVLARQTDDREPPR